MPNVDAPSGDGDGGADLAGMAEVAEVGSAGDVPGSKVEDDGAAVTLGEDSSAATAMGSNPTAADNVPSPDDTRGRSDSSAKRASAKLLPLPPPPSTKPRPQSAPRPTSGAPSGEPTTE